VLGFGTLQRIASKKRLNTPGYAAAPSSPPHLAGNGKTLAILRIELRTFSAHQCERDIITIRLYHHERKQSFHTYIRPSRSRSPRRLTAPERLSSATSLIFRYVSVLYLLEKTYPKSQGDRSTMNGKNDGRRAKLFSRVCGAKTPSRSLDSSCPRCMVLHAIASRFRTWDL
jgi:hypothetical protein